MRWYPHEGPQLEFCSRGEFEVLFGGAAGPGKTDCLIMEASRYVSFADYRAVLFRRTFPQLQEIIDRCWQWYPTLGAYYKATEHRWYFPSGAKIALAHMQHEANKYDHQGKEYSFCVHPDTEILLPGKHYKKISDIHVGEFVQTLIGPKEVTHKYTGIIRPSIVVIANGIQQIQSKNHRLMHHVLQVSHGMCGVFRPCAISLPKVSHCEQRSVLPSLLTCLFPRQLREDQSVDLEQILKQMQLLLDHLFLSVSGGNKVSQDPGTYFSKSYGSISDDALLVLSLYTFLGHPGLVRISEAFLIFRQLFFDGKFDALIDPSQSNYRDDYLKNYNQHGELLLVDEACVQSYLQQQDDVAKPIPKESVHDGQGKIRKYIFPKLLWSHPYTSDIYQNHVHIEPSSFFSYEIGLHKLIDIRVKDASHYITRGGFVNSNCGFDELTQFQEDMYLYLQSRVRSTNPDIPLRIRSTTNPGGIGHHWVKKRFLDIVKPMETYIDPKSGQSRAFIPATVYDNPTLINNDPLYVRRLEGLPEIEKKRLLYGDWESFEGQVFTELSDHTHGCDQFDIPHNWERFMVFDWGYSRPWAALWFAVDFDETIYLYRAYYAMGKGDDGKPDPNKGLRQTNSEICQVIMKQEKFERINMRIADPACWGPTKLQGSNKLLGPSFVEDAGRDGLFFLQADNDRLRGKQQIHERFKLIEELDSETGEIINETPRFYAFRGDENGLYGVRRWWDEMLNLHEDSKNVEDVCSDQADEGYDCLAAKTLVETLNGTIPIHFLSGKTGWVKTVFGLFTKFDHCKLYKINTPLMRVTFDDDVQVECTPNHKFLTKNLEWVEAKDLTNCIRYKRGSLCNQKSSNVQFKNLMESAITYVENTFKEMESYCIELYGNGIKAKCRLIALYITKMMTATIIISKILFRYLSDISANLDGAEKTNSIRSKEPVKYAAKHFWSIDTKSNHLAAENVAENFNPQPRGRCIKVESIGNGDAYCLTAAHTHAFSVNGGVIVANCTRYAFMSRPIAPKIVEKIPPGSFAAERARLIRAKKYARKHGVSLTIAYSRVR